VCTKVLGKGGTGSVFFCNAKCSQTESIVIPEAALGRWRFAEDGRRIFSHLDQFGCDQGVQPDQIGKHLLDLIVLHDCTFSGAGIKWFNLRVATFIVFRHLILDDNDVIP
jgi:hypothetical protein